MKATKKTEQPLTHPTETTMKDAPPAKTTTYWQLKERIKACPVIWSGLIGIHRAEIRTAPSSDFLVQWFPDGNGFEVWIGTPNDIDATSKALGF